MSEIVPQANAQDTPHTNTVVAQGILGLFSAEFITECVSMMRALNIEGGILWAIFAIAAAVLAIRLPSLVKGRERLSKIVMDPKWWAGSVAFLLLIMVFSPFVEQHRWPFSYPADQAVFDENSRLQNALNETTGALSREKELADKWRFASVLRQSPNCKYQIAYSRKAQEVTQYWQHLFASGGWTGEIQSDESQTIQPGITLRIGSATSPCAASAQRALTDIYPNPPSRIAPNQQSDFLRACGANCVQIEIDY